MTSASGISELTDSAPKEEAGHPVQPQNVGKSAKTNAPSSNGSEITVKEFLDFLKTAYQVQDNLETTLIAEGLNETVDWLKLKETKLVRGCEVGLQTSESTISVERKSSTTEIARRRSDSFLQTADNNDPIKRKLNEVLSEGILDSVLPYLVPSSQSQSNPGIRRVHSLKSIGSNVAEKNSNQQSNSSINTAVFTNKESGAVKKKSSTETTATSSTKSSSVIKPESEVEIHVCDEVKNLKKDFSCNQKLLVEKMGYFAEVTTGQRLEDMDISVHCDIGIFDWLMRWVKKDTLLQEELPQLDSQCVIPVLVSAAFLKMDPLLEECLLYCHQHMNEILRTNTNLSCINDTILTRLSAMYTNAEVEAIRDRKDKIQSRLFTKLIKSLVEPVPESVRGHWNSLARVFRCGKCKHLVSPSVGPKIPCIPSCMTLLCDGSIRSSHVRDPAWNIKEYILKLLKALKTWRKVYWRVWADAHFLHCTTCHKFFPSHQIGWCRYHPDVPQFFTIDAQKAPLPVGRYPCCGERAYRFQLFDNHAGCKFREHTPCAQMVRDVAVLNILETYRHLIEEEPPQLMFPERLMRLVARDPNASNNRKLDCKETFWWNGLQIVGPRPKLGLLGSFFDSTLGKQESPPANESLEASPEEDSSCTSSSSSSSEGSEESNPQPLQKTRTRKKKILKRKEGRLWQQNLSARSNQDIQRAREETAMKKIASILCRRVSVAPGDKSAKHSHRIMTRHVVPPGGIWVRLEADFKENQNLSQQQKARSIYTGKLKNKSTKPT